MGGSSSKADDEKLKDQDAEKLLRESAHGKNRGRSTESMMYGRRRRSDASLQAILRDPVVQDAFRRYLEAELAEELILFWVEVDKLMDLIVEKASIEVIKPRAKHIFTKFLMEGAAFLIELDSITREDIADVLDDEKADGDNVLKVFEVAFVKVFQKLKFEFMPRFLVSEQFNKLDVFKNSFDSENEANAVGLSYAADMDLSYVLNSPVGIYILKEYLCSVDSDQAGDSEEMVELIQQIDDYKGATENNHRMKRLQLIFKRFEPLTSGIKELGKVCDDYKEKVDSEFPTNYPSHLLDGVRLELISRLERDFYPEFRKSDHFAKLTGRVSRIFKKEMHEMDSKSLKSFAEERKFEEFKEMENVDLKDVMLDSLGLYYFRKFAERHFQEENVLFWCEVNHFNDEEYTKPPIGTALQYKGMLEAAQLQELRARKIFSKYIENNSRMELNLSYALRESVKSKVLGDEIGVGMFDDAQQEIYKLLDRNLWSKFKKSELYESWHSKRAARFERKLSSVTRATLK